MENNEVYAVFEQRYPSSTFNPKTGLWEDYSYPMISCIFSHEKDAQSFCLKMNNEYSPKYVYKPFIIH